MKKVTGSVAEEWYQGREPEYATMSRRPGIGYKWYTQFREETYRDDGVLARGHLTQPPRYYDKKEEEVDRARMEVVKLRRMRKNLRYVPTRELMAREVIAKAKLRMLEEGRR